MNIDLRAKDFDSYVSFLGRLNKLGTKYVLSKDMIVPVVKANRTGSNDIIPGEHYIRDPLYDYANPDNNMYVLADTIENSLELFKSIKKNYKDARKSITYVRDDEGIYIRFNSINVPIPIFSRIDADDCGIDNYRMYNLEMIQKLEIFSYYAEFIDSNGFDLTEADLIDIRANGVKSIWQKIDGGLTAWTRISKSLFPMAGTGRLDTPIALSSKYRFICDSNNSKLAKVLFHNRYKSTGDSKLVPVECIHEYTLLMLDDDEILDMMG
jgi:hypothetical protein